MASTDAAGPRVERLHAALDKALAEFRSKASSFTAPDGVMHTLLPDLMTTHGTAMTAMLQQMAATVADHTQRELSTILTETGLDRRLNQMDDVEPRCDATTVHKVEADLRQLLSSVEADNDALEADIAAMRQRAEAAEERVATAAALVKAMR